MNRNDFLPEYPEVLTSEDVEKILQLSKPTLYKLLDNGDIKCIKVGHKYRVPKLYLLQYLYPDIQFN